MTHLKRPWCWKGLRAGAEGDGRGWDGWMASPTGWTWVWVDSRCWWWTGRPSVLQFMGSQWIGHDWATELNWTEFKISFLFPRESSPFNVISGWFMRSLALLHFVWLSSQYLIKKNFQLSLFYSEYPQKLFDNDPVYSCLSCLLTQLEGEFYYYLLWCYLCIPQTWHLN